MDEIVTEVNVLKKRFWTKKKFLFLLLFLLFLMFRSIVLEPFRIPTGSMTPTLKIGDFIIVNKMAYGLKLPFSDFYSDPIYITKPGNPQRGDVIVFKFPQDPKINYIKRVVGLPGDKIEIKKKVIYINGKKVKTTKVPSKEFLVDIDEKYKNQNLSFYKSQIGKHLHFIQQDEDNYLKVDYRKKQVPKGNYFVMGDNRDGSYDSRFWGFVPHKYIKGKAFLVWFSMVLPFGNKKFKFRPKRIFSPIK